MPLSVADGAILGSPLAHTTGGGASATSPRPTRPTPDRDSAFRAGRFAPRSATQTCLARVACTRSRSRSYPMPGSSDRPRRFRNSKKMARERIECQVFGHQPGKAINRPSQIGDTDRRVDPHHRRERQPRGPEHLHDPAGLIRRVAATRTRPPPAMMTSSDATPVLGCVMTCAGVVPGVVIAAAGVPFAPLSPADNTMSQLGTSRVP